MTLPDPNGLLLAIVYVGAGFVLLAAGGEVLIRGAISISQRLRVSPAVIGLTIVAAATSLPELAVSLAAALRGNPDVAVGNVVGSNIFNVGAILGLTALIFSPLLFRAHMMRRDVMVMTGAAIAAMFMSRDEVIGKMEGGILIAFLVIFLVWRTIWARREGPVEEIEGELASHGSPWGLVRSIGMILTGAFLLTWAADVLVRGAIEIAEIAGVSQRVIAITLVSAGTGLPELATAIMAGIRRHAAVAVGNVIGSNIFNVFGILGTVAVAGPITVNEQIAHWDMWWFVGFCSVVLLPAFVHKRKLNRVGGGILLASYIFYVVTLLR